MHSCAYSVCMHVHTYVCLDMYMEPKFMTCFLCALQYNLSKAYMYFLKEFCAFVREMLIFYQGTQTIIIMHCDTEFAQDSWGNKRGASVLVWVVKKVFWKRYMFCKEEWKAFQSEGTAYAKAQRPELGWIAQGNTIDSVSLQRSVVQC